MESNQLKSDDISFAIAILNKKRNKLKKPGSPFGEKIASAIRTLERQERLPELLFQRGDRICVIDPAVYGSIRTTHLESYLIYLEPTPRVLIKCTANSSWHDLKNVYGTREAAKTALGNRQEEQLCNM